MLFGLAQPLQARPRTILFVGNSFTEGSYSAVREWRPDSVDDLNRQRIGGVPALFKAFTEQAGLDYAVSLETGGGTTLAYHYAKKRARIDRAWDVVVLQEYSVLDPDRPGDAAGYLAGVRELAALFVRRNREVRIGLTATWSRADQVYPAGGHWHGRAISAMAIDLRAAADRVRHDVPAVAWVFPVGQAWNRAFAAGIADPDPYDGRAPGQIDLWADDHYHASVAGYYLEALVVFGRVTGIDPASLGARERAAAALGLSPALAVTLQGLARDQLAATPNAAGGKRRHLPRAFRRPARAPSPGTLQRRH